MITLDPTWDHCEKLEEGKDRMLKLKCIHCGNAYWEGISRLKNHLLGTHKDVAPCTKCSNEVVEMFIKLLDDRSKDGNDEEDDVKVIGSGCRKIPASTITLNTMLKKKDRDEVCLDICRCLNANALPFNLVKDPYFKRMLEYVASFGK
uniref:BED-type domain-containing protein n=1 Tax=Davidia involucrata TaxID=16924 RepID=A0A5B6YVR6_DAVIN